MLSKLIPSGSFLTQIAATGLIGTIGDAICQTVVEKRSKYDAIRTLRFGLILTGFVGPFQYVWFRFLARNIGRPGESSFITGVKRMAVDQSVAAPIITSAFLFFADLAEKPHDVNRSIDKTKSLIGPVLINNYKLWPAVQIINMSLVPLHFRVVVVQFVAVFWNMYISYTINKKPTE